MMVILKYLVTFGEVVLRLSPPGNRYGLNMFPGQNQKVIDFAQR
jgi:hypothetical protein